MMQHQQDGGNPLPVDVYGSGEDMTAIQAKARENKLDINFHSGIDHLDDAIHAYRCRSHIRHPNPFDACVPVKHHISNTFTSSTKTRFCPSSMLQVATSHRILFRP